jgi:beta-galactosidase
MIVWALVAVAALGAKGETKVQELSKNWQFSRDKANWQEVTIPHDWAISGPFDKKWDLQVVAIKENGEETETEHSGRSGALPWIGEGYYKTQLVLPEGTERAELLFDGAMSEPVVYLDGKEVGRWAYGYNAFRVDITPYINGPSYRGELEVHLNNVEESSRWYPGAGLYRPVKLITSGRVGFDTWGMNIRTVKIEKDTALVAVDSKLNGCVIGDHPVITMEIIDRNGKIVAETQRRIAADGNCRMEFKIIKANLWSPESPYLYKIHTTAALNDEVVDERVDNLGVRTVAFNKKNGFQLNGVTRKFKGVCLHHDLGPLGSAANKAAMARQIKMMKEMGADAIRTSHNMPSTWQMELCDSLGMMVMAESFDCWKDPKVRNGYNRFWDEWWKKDIYNLIMNHRNHPSIVLWSVGNEIPEQWKEEGAERYAALVHWCHTLDPTRMVTCGMDNPDADIKCGFAQQADVPGFNYRVHRYEDCIKQLPQGFVLGSETASTVSSRGEYFFPDTCGIGKEYPNGQCNSYDLDHPWWSNLPDDDWRLQDDFDWTIGEFVWTGFDYLGEPSPYDAYWPSRSSYYGIVDLAGLPKDRYYLYRSHWNKDSHTIHLLPHWTWPDRKGKVTPVYCYTDYPSAELFVNGKSQGKITKDPTTRLDRYRLRWRDVVYEPGEIKVVVYDENGNKAGEKSVKTAGKPKRLQLDADRSVLNADGNDLAFITVSLIDKKGTLLPDADDDLQFTVEGAGTFRGVCNGDATSLQVMTKPQMKLFHGQLVVVVQASETPGDITLRVKGNKSYLNGTIKLSSK